KTGGGANDPPPAPPQSGHRSQAQQGELSAASAPRQAAEERRAQVERQAPQRKINVLGHLDLWPVTPHIRGAERSPNVQRPEMAQEDPLGLRRLHGRRHVRLLRSISRHPQGSHPQLLAGPRHGGLLTMNTTTALQKAFAETAAALKWLKAAGGDKDTMT